MQYYLHHGEFIKISIKKSANNHIVILYPVRYSRRVNFEEPRATMDS